ncbi:MAG: CvpA family protein [Bacteroidales bacterium]|nr:CvpA family protein [Bacteroidales bacterium]
MNLLDIIIAIPLIWLTYRGFTKGFIIEVASLAALILGIYYGLNFSDYAAGFLKANLDIAEKYLPIISFAVTFIVVVIVVYFIGRILEKLINLVALGFLNQLAGAAFGLAKAAFLLSVVFFIINSLDTNHNLITNKTRANSYLYEPVESIVPTVLPMINWEKFNIDVPFDEQEETL